VVELSAWKVSLEGESLDGWLVVELSAWMVRWMVRWLVVELSAWMVRMVVRLSARTDGWWSSCQLGW